jgi:hypothetical protein
MSHFIAAVITKDPDNYYEELAPYQENNMGDCPRQFLEFVNKTEEFRKAWQEETVERVKLPNGDYLCPWDSRLRVTITKEEYERLREQGDTHTERITSHFDEKCYKYDPSVVNGVFADIPYKDIYPTLEEYVKHCEGEDLWDDEMKAYGYWENPNAKWDSYGLCRAGTYGRWQDALVEEAFVKVRDFQLYEDKDKLIKQYNDDLEEVTTGKTPKLFFQLRYGKYKDAEDYANRNRIKAPWAFVLNGHWAERGQMGWWAASDATEESEDSFIKLFEKIMTDPEYQDYYIGFVNCHI